MPAPTATPSPTPEPPFPWTAFGPGTWRVGEQILPGVYEAANVSGQCEWASLSRFDDSGEKVAFSGTTATPVSVSILPTDAGFRASEGCGHWTPLAPPPTFTPTPTVTPLPPIPLHGFDAEAYFSGKSIVITVGVNPGGGMDAFARVLGTHIERALPGNPRFVVHNRPGAAVSSAAGVTGLDIVVVETTLIQQSIFGRVSEFDAPQWASHCVSGASRKWAGHCVAGASPRCVTGGCAARGRPRHPLLDCAPR